MNQKFFITREKKKEKSMLSETLLYMNVGVAFPDWLNFVFDNNVLSDTVFPFNLTGFQIFLQKLFFRVFHY